VIFKLLSANIHDCQLYVPYSNVSSSHMAKLPLLSKIFFFLGGGGGVT
jgi:hypothetical protein